MCQVLSCVNLCPVVNVLENFSTPEYTWPGFESSFRGYEVQKMIAPCGLGSWADETY